MSKPGAGLLKRDSNKIKYLEMILQRFFIYANIGLITVILAKEQGTTVDFTELFRQEGDLINILNERI